MLNGVGAIKHGGQHLLPLVDEQVAPIQAALSTAQKAFAPIADYNAPLSAEQLQRAVLRGLDSIVLTREAAERFTNPAANETSPEALALLGPVQTAIDGVRQVTSTHPGEYEFEAARYATLIKSAGAGDIANAAVSASNIRTNLAVAQIRLTESMDALRDQVAAAQQPWNDLANALEDAPSQRQLNVIMRDLFVAHVQPQARLLADFATTHTRSTPEASRTAARAHLQQLREVNITYQRALELTNKYWWSSSAELAPGTTFIEQFQRALDSPDLTRWTRRGAQARETLVAYGTAIAEWEKDTAESLLALASKAEQELTMLRIADELKPYLLEPGTAFDPSEIASPITSTQLAQIAERGVRADASDEARQLILLERIATAAFDAKEDLISKYRAMPTTEALDEQIVRAKAAIQTHTRLDAIRTEARQAGALVGVDIPEDALGSTFDARSVHDELMAPIVFSEPDPQWQSVFEQLDEFPSSDRDGALTEATRRHAFQPDGRLVPNVSIEELVRRAARHDERIAGLVMALGNSSLADRVRAITPVLEHKYHQPLDNDVPAGMSRMQWLRDEGIAKWLSEQFRSSTSRPPAAILDKMADTIEQRARPGTDPLADTEALSRIAQDCQNRRFDPERFGAELRPWLRGDVDDAATVRALRHRAAVLQHIPNFDRALDYIAATEPASIRAHIATAETVAAHIEQLRALPDDEAAHRIAEATRHPDDDTLASAVRYFASELQGAPPEWMPDGQTQPKVTLAGLLPDQLAATSAALETFIAGLRTRAVEVDAASERAQSFEQLAVARLESLNATRP